MLLVSGSWLPTPCFGNEVALRPRRCSAGALPGRPRRRLQAGPIEREGANTGVRGDRTLLLGRLQAAGSRSSGLHAGGPRSYRPGARHGGGTRCLSGAIGFGGGREGVFPEGCELDREVKSPSGGGGEAGFR